MLADWLNNLTSTMVFRPWTGDNLLLKNFALNMSNSFRQKVTRERFHIPFQYAWPCSETRGLEWQATIPPCDWLQSTHTKSFIRYGCQENVGVRFDHWIHGRQSSWFSPPRSRSSSNDLYNVQINILHLSDTKVWMSDYFQVWISVIIKFI